MKHRLLRVVSCLALMAPLGLLVVLWNSASSPAGRGTLPAMGSKEVSRLEVGPASSNVEATPTPAQVDRQTRQLIADRVTRELRAGDGAGEILPADFLDRIVTGKVVAFALPDGALAEGSVEMSEIDELGLLWIQGRLTKPAAGRYFLQRQTVEGVAGPLVGNILFDGRKDGWKIEPTADRQSARFVPRHEDDIICANYEKMAIPLTEEIAPYVAPQNHPVNGPLPPYQSVVALQSLPGATGVIYLDFDGEEGPFSGWGDFDAAHSGANNQQVFEVWKMVCEDFQGFNLNITTDRKVFDEAPQGRRQHVMITPTTTAAPGAGGVAYGGSYNWGGDTVCWSFYTAGKGACEVISHEVGHTLNLGHDGRNPSEGYYGGHGGGATGWAPIMGVGYYQNLTQWSKGEYPDANNLQDDLATIVNNNDVDYREDDAGDALATARYLEIAADNSVSNEGFVGQTGDIDAFRFATGGGQATLNVNAVALNPNLDILAEIVNAATSAVVVSNNPDTGIHATVSANLPAGEYLLRVRGTGRGDPLEGGYSDYGCLGTYLISGSVAGGVKPYRFTLAENPASGAAIGAVAARVNHGANPLAWSISAGNDSGGFAIDPASGALTVSDPAVFDYELQSLHWADPATFELFVTIIDSANPSLSESLRVVVTLTNANDAPRFAADPYPGRPGTPGVPYEGTLVATDQDAGSAAPTFSKITGPSWLSVAGNGTMTGNPTAVHMGTNAFTVRTSDSGGAFTDVTLLIEIVDVAVSPFWNNASGGSWTVAANWLGNSIADGPAMTGDFATLDLTNHAAVTLDGSRTIAGLAFADTTPSHNWTLAEGSGGTLTLAPASGPASVFVGNQMAIINAVVAGNQGLTKTGPGTLTLGAVNTLSGPISISQGILALSRHNALASTSYTLGDANTGANPAGFQVENGVGTTVTLSSITTSSFGTGHSFVLNSGGALAANAPALDCELNLAGSVPLTIKATNTGGHSTAQDWAGRIIGTGIATGATALVLDGTKHTLRLSFRDGSQPNTFTGDALVKGNVITQNRTFSGNNANNQNNGFRSNNVTVAAGGTWSLVWGGETLGALSGPGNVVLNCQNALNNIGITLGNNHGSGTFAGVISGSFGLVKSGTGTQALDGSNSYSGATTANGGTLVINGSLSASSAVTVNAGTTLSGRGTVNGTVTMNAGSTLAAGDAAVGTLTIANTLSLHNSGNVALRIRKSGALLDADRIRLTGASGWLYKGALTVSAAPGSEPLASGDKFTLFSKAAGTFVGSFASLNLASPGSGLMWDASGLLVDGSIQVVSSVIAETPAFSPAGGNLPGPVTVAISTITSGATIRYTTDGSDPVTSPSAVSGITPVGVTVPASATMTIKAYALKAGLADSPVVSANFFTVPADSITWTNSAGGSWPVSGNWLSNVVAHGTGVTARFDTLALPANPTVTLDSAPVVGSLIFGDTSNQRSWTLAPGTGESLTLAVASGTPVISVVNQSATISAALAGTQGVIKAGAGTLTLGGVNSLSGDSAIRQGTLVLTNHKGLSSLKLTLGDASTGADPVALKIDPATTAPVKLTAVRTSSFGSSHTVTLNSGSSLGDNAHALVCDLDLAGNLPLTLKATNTGGHGTAQDWSGRITGNGVAIGASALVLEGTTYPLRLSFGNSANPNTFTGDVLVKGNVSTQNQTYNGNSAGNQNNGFRSNDVTVASGASWSLVWGGETLGGLNGAGNINLNCQSALDNIGITLGNAHRNGSFTGAIGGSFGLAKTGSGIQILAGTNSYSGPTVIQGGQLAVNGSLGASSVVTIASGGTLAGRGTINGPVTQNAGGTLSAGDTTLGALTLANAVTLADGGSVALRIHKSGNTRSSDRIHRTGSNNLAFKGTLKVSFAPGSSALAPGDKFTLFSKTTGVFSGSFAAFDLPAPGPDLAWNTALLAVDGSIEVTSSTMALTPVFSPDSGTFLGAQSITLSTATTGASIRYTMDGTDPASSATAVTAAAPVTVSLPLPAEVTIAAYALKAGLSDSPVATASFTTVAPDQPRWINPAGGSWPASANWLGQVVAAGQDITACFDTLDLTADAGVALDGARTIGGLKFGDTTPSHHWALTPGTGGSLTLAVGAGKPAIAVANQTTTIHTVLAGSQGLVKSGAGTLLLAAPNTLTGSIVISQGRLALSHASALPATAAVVIGDANSGTTAPNLYLGSQLAPAFATLTVGEGVSGATLHTGGWAPAVTGVTTLNGALTIQQYNGGTVHTGLQTSDRITGPGAGAGNPSLIFSYGGAQNFYWQANNTSANDFAGNILVTGAPGNLNAQGGANGPNNTVIPDAAMVAIDAGCAFRWNNFGNNAVNETIDGLAGAGDMSRNNSGGLISSLNLTINASNGANEGKRLFTGSLSSVNNLTFTGTGTQVFAGSNGYTGPTAVNGGTLLVNGSQANTATTVAAAGKLGGTGILAGSVACHGTLAPGSNGVGNLTVNNTLTMAAGSKLAWDVSNWTGAAGTGWDKLTVTSLNITATSSNRITIRTADLALANFSEAGTAFVIVQTSAGITGFSADKFTVDTTGLTLPHGTWAVQQSGNSLVLAYTAQADPDGNGNGIFDVWETARFGNADAGANPANEDPDGDGLSNLMEYALGTDPLQAAATPLGFDLVPLADGKHLRLTVPKNPEATNVTYHVETGGALDDWSPVNTTVESDTADQLIVRDNFTTATAARRYIRLRVEAQP
jgi:autotransporter-associated beta strand protein